MLNFTFTIDETNEILGSLSAQPYAKVSELISKITSAAQEQLVKAGPTNEVVMADND